MLETKSSRRGFLKASGSIGAMAVLGVGALRSTRALAATEVVAALFPGAWEDEFQKVVVPYLKERSGVDLIISPALASDQLGKMMASSGRPPYDALLMSPGQSSVAKERGLIEKIDPSRISNWNELPPDFQDEWGPAMTVQLDGLAYNPDKVRKPNGYADIFGPDFYGQVALAGMKSNSMVMAYVQMARAFGGSEDDLSPLWPRLKELLPHLGALANDMNHQQSLFQQGEISVMVASTNNVARLKSLGVSAEFVVPEEGAPATPVNIHLTKGAQDPDAVHAYIDAVISRDVQQALQEPPLENFPANVNVEVTPSIAQYMTREQLSSFVYLDWAKINAHREEWTRRFDEVVSA